jgi:hypothetical protein
MKAHERPLPIKNAPLHYAPENELGVVFLFSHVAKRLQFRIEKIRAAYPDCIAYRYVGDREKRVRIEFELRSSSFRAHKHNAKECDCIVCWDHDWRDVPEHIEVACGVMKSGFTPAAMRWWRRCAASRRSRPRCPACNDLGEGS